MDFRKKYLKYKLKYIELLNQYGDGKKLTEPQRQHRILIKERDRVQNIQQTDRLQARLRIMEDKTNINYKSRYSFTFDELYNEIIENECADMDLIKILIHYTNINLNTQDSEGKTLLFILVKKVISLFEDHKAMNPGVSDDDLDNLTIFNLEQQEVYYKYEKHMDILDYLLSGRTTAYNNTKVTQDVKDLVDQEGNKRLKRRFQNRKVT